MKYSFLLTLGLCSFVFVCNSTPSQSTAQQLATIQTSLDGLINQSNENPNTIAELTELTDVFIALAQNSNEQELQALQGAAHVSCLFEGGSSLFNQDFTATDLQILNSLTYSSRSNTIQKLILASANNLFNDPNYTNSYIESVGYIANEWLCNSLLSSSMSNISSTTISSNPLLQTVISRVISGIIATYAWSAQKNLFFSSSIPAKVTKFLRRITT